MQDQKTINHLKGMIINAVHLAKSGHPGGALSSLDFAYLLFTENLKFDPDDSTWLGRDRFILSAGHESLLLYSLLRAIGWLTDHDLKNFRQYKSKTPGHPENHLTPGVECTTGPLGQGAAMSVGFAIANLHFQAHLDRELFDNKIWVILGDGCMQEGITYSAASFAGHLKLHNLVWFYDKNKKQISGSTSRVTSDNEQALFESLGWKVITIDGHNHNEIREALQLGRQEKKQPLLIIGNTVIAKGTATMENSHKTHGAPLPDDERKKTLQLLGVPEDQPHFWPNESKQHFQRQFQPLREKAAIWRQDLAHKLQLDKEFKQRFNIYFKTSPHKLLPKKLINWNNQQPLATRSAFGSIISQWADLLPNFIGGSADLEPSNMTEAFALKVKDFTATNRKGNNLAFGVREFPMSAICNGLALYGGLIPFDATFLAFSDYSRAALRLGSLQKAKVIHEFTHDSFYLGEDGPTHQPIEHLMSLRAIPDLYIMRPSDAEETELLMRQALVINSPSCFCLSRQKLNYLPYPNKVNTIKGAWTVNNPKVCELIIFASGSEVHLALKVCKKLEQLDKFINKIKVVALSCWELFFQQDISYQQEIMTYQCKKRVSIEAGATLGWEKFIGIDGLSIGIDTFGSSAPSSILEESFGFTVDSITQKINTHFY